MDWVRVLAYITGTVDRELVLRNEYLAAENRSLKSQLKTRLQLTDAERITLAEIAHRLGPASQVPGAWRSWLIDVRGVPAGPSWQRRVGKVAFRNKTV